jgi:hypothetical protein
VSKKYLEQHIFFWDTESHTVPPNDNDIYSVGFVKSDEYAMRDEKYDKLMDDAVLFYGENAFELFENFLIAKSE